MNQQSGCLFDGEPPPYHLPGGWSSTSISKVLDRDTLPSGWRKPGSGEPSPFYKKLARVNLLQLISLQEVMPEKPNPYHPLLFRLLLHIHLVLIFALST